MATRKKDAFNPRQLMEKAVEVMRRSLSEPRNDGKSSPKVGALLWKPDGRIQTACRGELRDGDHAEFTILERMNRDKKLDDCVLFATLEPCAPGSRHPYKMSCAERIVNARIKKAWVGIEDPDPKVDRKGIKYMQDAGIEVEMFDRDLQQAILKENADFLAQALERARAAKEEPVKKVVLSPLEKGLDTVTIDDLSADALERYRSLANIKDNVGSESFNRRLLQQGLIARQQKQIMPTGFGFLLFGKEPRTAMPQAGMLATIEYGENQKEVKDFDGPLVTIPEDLEKWLRDKLPNVIDRGAMRRKEVPSLPFEMVREAVVNALIHRDYDIRQAKCQLVVTGDSIAVKSPGGPVPPITLEQLQSFDAPMLSRNPELHYVFARMELAEERGLGLKSLKQQAEAQGLPLPTYRFRDPYLELAIYRNPEAAVDTLPKRVASKLNPDEKAAWRFIATRESVTARELMEQLEIDERKAQRVLKKLGDLRLVRRVGKGRATRYEVVRS